MAKNTFKEFTGKNKKEMNGSQDLILKMIQTRGRVTPREFVRELPGWDWMKAITRLRRKGYPIENLNPPGIEAIYVWAHGGQLPLISGQK